MPKAAKKAATAILLVSTAVTAGAPAAFAAEERPTARSTVVTSSDAARLRTLADPRSGTLYANEPKKVVWGAGFFQAQYGVRLVTADGKRPTGQYACYTAGIPTSSGEIHNGFGQFTLLAYPYAECWITSPYDASYELVTS
ncbi:hypothetical protein OHA09_35150 [Streptomyces longwoodensis]|uniref:hypothetical protein n=1 Tax=Streptomyces longwoodensis TaxID=68231 RepID=UPI0022508D30|nr:hypothetical protein [Streptomyces longwoodensis]MCX5000576.1 hypothetical protein [Streptomyces longwoodensis]WTI49267.1 hypothetical protein OG547_34460 [Streptomyces longwoodensis]WUC61967.1 hypothetical protein OHA09_35150 [Streptomyces longwoodensis]